MRRWISITLWLVLAIATPALAQEKVYDIANYDVDLVLRTDGSYRVTERITFDFQQGNFTFATRNIPLDKIDRITEMQVQSEDVVLRDVTVEMRDEEQFIRELPWLSLDSDVNQRWVKKLADSLKEAREELYVPPWAEDLTDETVEAASQAYVAFHPYYHVTTATAAAVAPSSGVAGASAAGAGAGGGGGGAG